MKENNMAWQGLHICKQWRSPLTHHGRRTAMARIRPGARCLNAAGDPMLHIDYAQQAHGQVLVKGPPYLFLNSQNRVPGCRQPSERTKSIVVNSNDQHVVGPDFPLFNSSRTRRCTTYRRCKTDGGITKCAFFFLKLTNKVLFLCK